MYTTYVSIVCDLTSGGYYRLWSVFDEVNDLKMISKIVLLVFVLVFVISGTVSFDTETTVEKRLDPFKRPHDDRFPGEGPSDQRAADTEGIKLPHKPHNSATTTNIPETPTSGVFQQLEDQLYGSLKSSEDVFSFLKHGTFLEANDSESTDTAVKANATALNHTSSELGKQIGQVFDVFKTFLDAFSSPVSNTSEKILSSTPPSVLDETTVPDETDEYERSIEGKNAAEIKPLLENRLDKGSEKVEKASVSNTSSSYLDRQNTSSEKVSACYQKVDPGLCRAFIPKWYFNSTDSTCTKFIYGGCHGNKNNFEAENICYATCTGEVPCKADPAKVCRLSESPCKNATCVGHADAVCYLRPCTCEVYFVDAEGEEVNCRNVDGQSDLSKAGDVADQDTIHCPEDQERVCHMAGSACEHLTCPEHPEARCTMLPCTCETVFRDEDGLLVNCDSTLNESPNSSGKDSLNKNHSIYLHKKLGTCTKLGIGLATAALLSMLILAFGVGCFRKRRANGSYSMFTNLSGSIASLLDRHHKEGFAEYTAKKPGEDSLVCFQGKV